MSALAALGIDCGGTHTDAALLEISPSGQARLLRSAKCRTRHEDLPGTVLELLGLLARDPATSQKLKELDRVTVGATLEVNSLIEGKADKVGLALSAGPGLKPEHFVLGSHHCVVPGGLDHRGEEAEPLRLDKLEREAARWAEEGVAGIACVGKFSPRNPSHEIQMGKAAAKASGLPITLGHSLSGKLDFPKRIATAYFNAAVLRLHGRFLDALEEALRQAGINAQCRLLKADGGAIPFSAARRQAVDSILSGPAASVMGALAAWPGAASGCSLLLDIGGTTTDAAVFFNGSPILDRGGMRLLGRGTLIRSIATVSLGIGGDSLLKGKIGASGPEIRVGPQREGPAMAFGGKKATLLDALNFLDGSKGGERGDVEASRRGMEAFTAGMGLDSGQTPFVAELCVEHALAEIRRHAHELLAKINSGPIHTLAALRALAEAKPEKACVVGGPAHCLRERLERALAMPVELGPHAQVANAIGAALAKPTASLEIYADTGKGRLSAPSLDLAEKIPASFSLEAAEKRACELLRESLRAQQVNDADVEVVQSDLFATLDDYGRGARDMRVTVQARPGLAASLDAHA